MRIFLAVFMIAVGYAAKSQSCAAPTPLTAKQVSLVKGDWTGHYEWKGKRTDFSVLIGSTDTDKFTSVSSPPLEGEALEEVRFCGAGAFHFRKEVADGFFEFDGVPEGNLMKGTLVVESAGEKTTGVFELTRTR